MANSRPKHGSSKRRARTKKTKVRLPESFLALIVTEKPHREQAHLEFKYRQVSSQDTNGGCIFPTHDPTSVVTPSSGVTICKYSVAGDANSSDSVSFGQEGPLVVEISLVPIFYGSSWLISTPSYTDVMEGIATILTSPYLSQLDQYGFHSLNVKQPVLNMVAKPATRHSSDDAGDIVWNLIDNDVFPEPDDPGGYNIYMVFYPQGTSVSDISACGWHDRYDDFDFPFDLDFAWVGAVDFPVGDTSSLILDNIIRVFSHELVEIITDPEGFGGWVMSRAINGGAEISDACNNSVDYLRGMLVNAYWSQRHKACIIPKPSVSTGINVTDAILSTAVIASGVAEVPRLICLSGSYSWAVTFEEHQIILTAMPSGFQNPQFAWRIEEGQSGPVDLPDGFSGTVFLATDTWYEDVTGASMGFGVFPVDVTVNADRLTLTNGAASNLFSFLLKARLTAFEGALSASAEVSYRVSGETFKFEPGYYEALKACLNRISQLLHTTLERVPPIGPGDPAWVWQDGLSPWITPNRLLPVAAVASGCASIQNFKPQLAHDLRAETALIASVPAKALLPTQIRRGMAQRQWL